MEVLYHMSEKISTHTPVRVWHDDTALLDLIRISTHTPVRVWPEIAGMVESADTFQLTHPWGCDIIIVFNNFICIISTHTPVRVWPFRKWTHTATSDFNSHTREGVTNNRGLVLCAELFQLTHPWGCDQWFRIALKLLRHFNSHTREGVTMEACCTALHTAYFNSHTREGVTCNIICKLTSLAISTHTPVRVWRN